MQAFLIILSEKQPHLLNEILLKAHIDHLKQLKRNRHLLIAGPCVDNQNAMLVIRADSKTQAETLVKQDPFVSQSYYKKFTIHEFMEACEENNWLMEDTQTQRNNNNPEATNNFITWSNGNPKTISVLSRKLKSGKTYHDFRQAWLPPVVVPKDEAALANYFSVPVRVINAQNCKDPSEIISIGLVWASVQEIEEESKRVAHTEKLRGDKIMQVADKIVEPKIYEVRDIDDLAENYGRRYLKTKEGREV